jgi:hypothetical protein
MFQDEINARAYKCPKCGNKLVHERDELRCEKPEDGSFFFYGSRLLVCVPRQNVKLPHRQLPWEN